MLKFHRSPKGEDGRLAQDGVMSKSARSEGCKSRPEKRRQCCEANREPKRIKKRSESQAEAGTIIAGGPGRGKALAGGRPIRPWATERREFVNNQALTYFWCRDVFLVSSVFHLFSSALSA